jgi:glycosyltransferase involved in cell wall biosynthesis
MLSTRTSVIVPVRNGVRFISEALDSALQQLTPDDEIVVVDDASSDGTLSVLNRMQDRRIRVLAGSGRGVSSARNIGLAAASGAFIAFLDHDDLWPPARHPVLLGILMEDPSIDCVTGRLRIRMEHDAVALPQLPTLDGQLAPNISLCTALFRRRILDAVGWFDEDMRFCEDTDYLMRLMELEYRVVLCDTDALIYRRHSTNATCDVASAERGFMELIRRRRIRMSRKSVAEKSKCNPK